MKLPWPQNLRGQMVALVLIGLGIAQLLAFAVYRIQQEIALRSLSEQIVMSRTAGALRLLADTPVNLHGRILRAVGSPRLHFRLAPVPLLQTTANDERGRRLQAEMANLLALPASSIRVGVATDELLRDHHRSSRRHRDSLGPDRSRDTEALVLSIQLAGGQWLNVIGIERPTEPFWRWSMLLYGALAALILSLLMIVMVRRITRPLALLAREADRFGRGEPVAALIEQGAADIRHTIRAFNTMRSRLDRFVQDRMRMLAAISHDLRTPITALRLRVEMIDDPELRNKMLGTLDEMQQMSEVALTFVREESIQENVRPVDLAALLESLCDDLSDTGHEVEFNGPGKTPYSCRPLALKRALRNVLENAVRYGQRARVSLSAADDSLRIRIDDNGPGIAEADFERVFEPFVRLETSRNRATGGVGLGLAIARGIVHRHGGEISLQNRKPNGLQVTLVLPKAKA